MISELKRYKKEVIEEIEHIRVLDLDDIKSYKIKETELLATEVQVNNSVKRQVKFDKFVQEIQNLLNKTKWC